MIQGPREQMKMSALYKIGLVDIDVLNTCDAHYLGFQYMTTFCVVFSLEPLKHHKVLAAGSGHTAHVPKTALHALKQLS